VIFRADALEALFGRGSRLGVDETAKLWDRIGAVQLFDETADRCIWRICPTPAASSAVLRDILVSLPRAEAFYDWGGGLLWLSFDENSSGPDGGAAIVRAAVRKVGGYATLIRASAATRVSAGVFEMPVGPLNELTRKIKASFDPHGVLNAGRMQEGY
jgi:glycolate oxidase FAD binding subunit